MLPLLASLLLASISSSIPLVRADTAVTVTLSDGALLGLASPVAQRFLGVPYAAPPLGALRWASPQPVQPWAPRVRNATAQAPGCPQKCILPPLVRLAFDFFFLDQI